MTTIAYKDGVIAYDSRATVGPYIEDDEFDKKAVFGDLILFVCGSPAVAEGLSRYLLEGIKEVDSEERSIEAFCVAKGMFERSGFNRDDGFYRCKMNPAKHYAIGSGQDHAITAMDMGATAQEAVKMAMKRDTGTGGKIRTYKVK